MLLALLEILGLFALIYLVYQYAVVPFWNARRRPSAEVLERARYNLDEAKVYKEASTINREAANLHQ